MKLSIINEKKIRRMDAIRSLEVVAISGEPVTQFIPTEQRQRIKMYKEFGENGVHLPPYSTFKRKSLRKRDMQVLTENFYIKFRYKDTLHTLRYKKGFCFDGASIPMLFRYGNGTAHNQYVKMPALVHDALFAKQYTFYEDANNIFSALLRYKGMPKFTLARIMFGVRSPIGRRLYKKSNPATTWMNGFVFHIFERYK